MKTPRTNLLLITFIICFLPSFSEAADYRNILALSSIDYDGIGRSNVLEDTFIARVHPRISTLARFYRDQRSSWDNTIVTAGPVLFLARYTYCELSYGYGKASNGNRSDFFNVELTREKPGLTTGLGYRHSVYEDFSIDMISPSLRIGITKKYEIFGKYFMSLDSDSHFDHAIWMEGNAYCTRRFGLGIGFTAGNRLYSPEYESTLGGGTGSFFSWIVKCSWTQSDRIGIRYQFERLSRDKNAVDIRNGLVIDVRVAAE